MDTERLTLWLPILAGLFRIIVASNLIALTAPILSAAISTLYTVFGLYALQHALIHLKALKPYQTKKHHIFFGGFCVLFFAKRSSDLYHYLNSAYNFVLPAYPLFTILSEKGGQLTFIQILANNLPMIAFSVLTALTFYHLFTSKTRPRGKFFNDVIKILDFSFILVSGLFCISSLHTSISLWLYQGLSSIITLPTYFLTLSEAFETMASCVLFVPRAGVLAPMPETSEVIRKTKAEQVDLVINA